MNLPNVTIPSPIILLIPLVVSALLGYLQEDKLPKLLNAVLASFFFLVTAGLCLLLGGLITPNISADVYLYLAYTFAILNYGPCATLRQMVMDQLSSPLLAFIKPKQNDAPANVAPPDPIVEAWQQSIDRSPSIAPANVTNVAVPPFSLPSRQQPPKPITLMPTQPNPTTPAVPPTTDTSG